MVDVLEGVDSAKDMALKWKSRAKTQQKLGRENDPLKDAQSENIQKLMFLPISLACFPFDCAPKINSPH